MTAPEIKQCPAGCHTDFVTMQQVGMRHMMKCDCGWTAPIRANKERAITAWNTRTDLIPSDPRVTALAEAADALRRGLSLAVLVKNQHGIKLRADFDAALAQLKGAANE